MGTFAFNDLINSNKPIKVVAEISFISENEGGRSRPVQAIYRPNHNFGPENHREFYIGQVEIPEDNKLYPGETYILPITFINGPGLSELLSVGRKWRIQEGPRLVARAKIIKVGNNT